jgi:hypothetical protein
MKWDGLGNAGLAPAFSLEGREGRGKKEEGRRKKEEGRRKKEEGRRKKEEGRRKKGYPRRSIYKYEGFLDKN